jgi:glycosyltransferase involved in cell wall biosynthesis
MRSLKLSVVLPTFNRADSLRVALAALLRQDTDSAAYEIVVVDNNSSDHTPEVLSAVSDPRVRRVREVRQGLSFARNAGLAAARADLLAFTDDDVEADPQWVSRVIAAFDSRPDIDGVGGQVLPSPNSPPPPWLTRAHWAPLALQDHGDVERTFDAASPIGLIGANVAFRRRVFEHVGVFSPDVQRVRDGVGSTEDHELLGRLYDAGGRMLYTPAMRVIAYAQPERFTRAYHRRWHTGHGASHARMRRPDMEGTRVALMGVPGHLLRSAVVDASTLLGRAVRGDWEGAFAAELRLRFFWGFLKTRVSGRLPSALQREHAGELAG